ncbi:MAG: virulence RhuM family protein, partial [Nitrososphaerota archaeon]|nr:virulence RhuM family protein [Nitrososphaerota archaeon]
ELQNLGMLVNAYLDLAERRAKNHIPMTMEGWAKHLDLILQADGNELLVNAGRLSAQIAKEPAESEFEKYRVVQDKLFENDFDKQLKLFEKQATAADTEEDK